MPQIKHYDGKKKSTAKGHSKRRPHREEDVAVDAAIVEEIQIEVEAEAINTEAQNEGASPETIDVEAKVVHEEVDNFNQENRSFHFQEEAPADKVHLEFYGSELIRQKAPKVMELAETVVEEWTHDGQFEGLPVGNPIAQIVAAKALRKAKDVEKKLEEKGVFMMAKVGVEYLKAEIQKRKK